MFSLFYRNLRLLVLALILIVVWGLTSLQALPRLEDPNLVSRNAIVTTYLPGAEAERVETLITETIEAQLTDIGQIEKYQSTSRAGVSLIELELSEQVTATEVSGLWAQIRDRLNDAALAFPPGATNPELEEVEVKAYALVAALTWNRDDDPNYAILRRLAAALQDRLSGLPGTELVDLFGDPQEEIVVQINPGQLASLGLSPQTLSQQLVQTDVKVSAGKVRGEYHNFPIALESELDSLERLAQTPVRLGHQGQVLRLGDVAQIEKGMTQPLADMAFANGQPAVVLGAFVQSDYHIDRWAKQAQAVLEDFQGQLTAGVSLQIIFDQTDYVHERLSSLLVNLVLGATLVFGVTLVMMGWQSAVVVSLALPLSLLMVLGLMRVLGMALHQISVTGLIVALGLLIDTAIVMVDEVYHQLKTGARADLALQQSIQNLAMPLFTSTLTTVLAFMPVAFLPGRVGEFVSALGVSVILAVSCSFLLSVTIIPALAAHLFNHWQRRHGPAAGQNGGDCEATPAWWQQGVTWPGLAHLYQRLLAQTTRHPKLGLALALMLPLVGLLQGPLMEQQFFPASDRDQLQLEVEFSPSTALSQTQLMTQQMRTYLLQHAEVDAVHWFIGTNAPRFYYNLTGRRENEPNYAQALVQLNRLSTAALTRRLQAELDQAFPAARAVVRQLEQGPPFDAPIEIRIKGPNLRQLQALGEAAQTHLNKLNEVTHTRASLNKTMPQVQFALDEAAVRLAGLDLGRIAQDLDQSLEGIQGGSVLEDTEELPIRVQLADRSDLSAIATLPLATQAGDGWLPLSALGSPSLKPRMAQITHYNGQRVNLIQSFVQAGTLPATVLAKLQRQLQADHLPLPPGYTITFGGEAEERAEAIQNLRSNIDILTVLMIAVLVLALGSFRLAGLIGIVAVASFGLGLFSIALFGYPFGFNPIIGTVGLVGIAINDSIVVLAALEQHPMARLGDPLAIQEIVLRSTRHILTTTLTTVIGFVPLFLEGGEFWPPFAIVIAGGVTGATLLALMFVPSSYLLLRHKPAWKRSGLQP